MHEDSVRITPDARAENRRRDLNLFTIHQECRDSTDRRQVPTDMTTTAARTAKRAMIINTVGESPLTRLLAV
jgi:hypothetical protein